MQAEPDFMRSLSDSSAGLLQVEWKSPYPKPLLARGSPIDLMPDAVSPLFATLGIPIVTQVFLIMYAEVMGLQGEDVPIFVTIHGYPFLCFIKRSKFWKYMLAHGSTVENIYEYGKKLAEEAHTRCSTQVDKWRQVDLASVLVPELLAGVCALYEISADFLCVSICRPIHQSNFSELFFSLFYNNLIKRKEDPIATAFLLGLENLPLRADDHGRWPRRHSDMETITDPPGSI